MTVEPYIATNCYGEYNFMVSAGSADKVCGNLFTPMAPCYIPGGTFYSKVTGAHTIKVCLWHPDGSLIDSVDEVCSGPGTHLVAFSELYEVTEADLVLLGNIPSGFIISMWEKTGTYYTKAGVDRTHKKQIQGYCYSFYPQLYGTGDVRPTSVSGSETYPIDPIISFTPYDGLILPNEPQAPLIVEPRGYYILINDQGDNELDDNGHLVRDYTIASKCRFRLKCRRGEYWADPNIGSRFHTIKLLKDAEKNVETYAIEALQDLIDDGEVKSVTKEEIIVDHQNQMLLGHIFITASNDEKVDLGLIPLGR